MSTIQWRPEINALTTPQSYVPRHVPRAVLGNDELAARMEQRNPLYTQTLGKSFLLDLAAELREQLVSGNQISLDDLFTCHITFSGRLDSPGDHQDAAGARQTPPETDSQPEAVLGRS